MACSMEVSLCPLMLTEPCDQIDLSHLKHKCMWNLGRVAADFVHVLLIMKTAQTPVSVLFRPHAHAMALAVVRQSVDLCCADGGASSTAVSFCSSHSHCKGITKFPVLRLCNKAQVCFFLAYFAA